MTVRLQKEIDGFMVKFTRTDNNPIFDYLIFNSDIKFYGFTLLYSENKL